GNAFMNAAVEVAARGGVDLSQIEYSDVQISPSDVTVVKVFDQTRDKVTVGLLFYPVVDRNAVRYLQVQRDINLTAEFKLAEANVPKLCPRGQRCCEKQESGSCTLCLPFDQLCR